MAHTKGTHSHPYVRALKRMAEYGVLPVLSTKMRFEVRIEALYARLKESILWYRLSFLDEPLEMWWAYFLALFAGLPAEEAVQALVGSFKLSGLPQVEVQPDWIKRFKWLDRVPWLPFRIQVIVLE